MANFYLDNPAFLHYFHHPLMKRIVELKERNFTEKDKFDYALSIMKTHWTVIKK